MIGCCGCGLGKVFVEIRWLCDMMVVMGCDWIWWNVVVVAVLVVAISKYTTSIVFSVNVFVSPDSFCLS